MQIANCKLQIEKCRQVVGQVRSARKSRIPRSSFLAPRSSLRRGVTLIELLVVMLIISILAALVLGVAAIANETARQAQTKHMVERLHTLLTEYYGTYKTRRVKLNPAIEAKIAGDSNTNAAQKNKLRAQARLYALRELMLMEMPDRWTDVLLSTTGSVPKSPIYLDVSGSGNGRTALANLYLRRYQQLLANINQLPASQQSAAMSALPENQGAECLYMIITEACGDGEARTLFAEKNIGDTDGDGAPEFLDGWGHPIEFLRWAPGFDSQIQLNANDLGDPVPNNTAWISAAAGDHDPFDLYRVDPLAFRLVPLIYSGGRDEALGLHDVKTYVWQGLKNPANLPSNVPLLNPYQKIDDGGTLVFPGTANTDGTATDNVHNHLMGQR